jgi:hypothetical protein
MSYKIFPTYGFPAGTQAYGQYRDFDFNYVESFIDGEAIIVKFLDRDGFFLHSFHSNTQNFPFAKVKFDFIGESPYKLDIIMTKHPVDYKFDVHIGDIVELYVFNSSNPYWSGVITSRSAEINTDQLYKFNAEGLKKRLERCYTTQTSSSDTISSFITSIINLDVIGNDQVVQLLYDSSKIESVSSKAISMKYENKKVSDALNQLSKIAGNYEWGVDSSRYFYFKEKPSSYSDPIFRFLAGVNASEIEIAEADYSNMVNRLILEKKSTGGAGVSFVGTYEASESVAEYGTFSKTIQIPETSSSDDAENYGVQYVALYGSPSYKAQVSKVPFFDYLNSFPIASRHIKGNVYARISSEEKNFFETLNNCDSTTNFSESSTDIVLSVSTNIIRFGDGSIVASITTDALNDYFALSIDEDWDNVNEVSFWCRSENTGNNFQFGFGSTDYDENLFNVYVSEADRWEKITLNVSTHTRQSVKEIGWKCVDADSTDNFRVDAIQKYGFGRKEFDLEVKKIEVTFEKGQISFDVHAGTLDYPMINRFLESWREIEALKVAQKTT